MSFDYPGSTQVSEVESAEEEVYVFGGSEKVTLERQGQKVLVRFEEPLKMSVADDSDFFSCNLTFELEKFEVEVE